MAIGVLQEAAARGLRVPEDLSVVGFDGIEAAAWTSPPLTTVEQPIDDIAETAVNALRSLIDDPQKAAARLLVPAAAHRARFDGSSARPLALSAEAERGSPSRRERQRHAIRTMREARTRP